MAIRFQWPLYRLEKRAAKQASREQRIWDAQQRPLAPAKYLVYDHEAMSKVDVDHDHENLLHVPADMLSFRIASYWYGAELYREREAEAKE